jgi:hypothetical protein
MCATRIFGGGGDVEKRGSGKRIGSKLWWKDSRGKKNLPHLRRWGFPAHDPALTHWANVCRASGAEERG